MKAGITSTSELGRNYLGIQSSIGNYWVWESTGLPTRRASQIPLALRTSPTLMTVISGTSHRNFMKFSVIADTDIRSSCACQLSDSVNSLTVKMILILLQPSPNVPLPQPNNPRNLVNPASVSFSLALKQSV